jgi:hypothetical protein
MGRHGGLNILPQKKWNVYNWDNRLKVEEDEKLVNDEIEKRKKNWKLKRLKEKLDKNNGTLTLELINEVKMLKSDYDNLSDNEKTKIYMEIMNTKTNLKKAKRDLNFKNNNKIPEKFEKINFEDIKTTEEIDLEFRDKGDNLTFKESLNDIRLKPWYSLPKKIEFEKINKSLSNKKDEQYLNKKRKNNINTISKNKLKAEREIRESLEHQRILDLLNSNKNK